MGLRIAIGADPSGQGLKDEILKELTQSPLVDGILDVDARRDDHEPLNHIQVATEVATRVADGLADRGLAFCGNGLGVTIAANHVEGVAAVTAHDLYSVRTSLTINQAQVLCMGANVIGVEPARMLVKEWLSTAMPGDLSS